MQTPMRQSGSGLPASGFGSREPAQLADVLERVLDKGIVIAGDIQINLLDIELLTIKLRLLVASADKAREMGIDWWEGDPFLTRGRESPQLEERIERLERSAGIGDGQRERRR
jgi:Gas vesicle protein